MDPLVSNPFAVLTFIAAPAVLTNASSVMALGTSNRFARAIDRARELADMLRNPGPMSDELRRLRVHQLRLANRRAVVLVRALGAFYLSLGSFAAASFASLVGAAFVMAGHHALKDGAMVAALLAGVVGVSGLVGGSALLVTETRMTLAAIAAESALVVRELHLEDLDRGPGEGG